MVRAGWEHVGDNSSGAPMYRRSDEATSSYRPAPVYQIPVLSGASIDAHSRAYRALLSVCGGLSRIHRTEVEKRGIPRVFELLNMATLEDGRGQGSKARAEIVGRVLELSGLSERELAGVAGFYAKGGRIHLAGAAGVLIPFYDSKGRIVSMQIRRSGGGDPRYVYLSSSKYGGSKPLSTCGFLRGSEQGGRFEITEGAYKGASVVAHLPDTAGAFYLAGVGQVDALQERIEDVGIARVQEAGCRVWFDADALTNAQVLDALARLLERMEGMEIPCEVMGWEIAKGKGIDDYLAAGGALSDVENHDVSDIKRAATRRKSSSHLRSSQAGNGGREVPILPDATAIFERKDVPSEAALREATEAAFLEAMQSPVGTFFVHDGSTGTGKTRAVAKHLLPRMVYVARNYKALFDAEKAIKAEDRVYRMLFGRAKEPDTTNADLDDLAMRARLWNEAGCENYETAAALGARGWFSCTGCSRYKDRDCSYWKQREEALASGEHVLLTCSQTLARNGDIAKAIDGQMTLDGRGLAGVVFDDIDDLVSVLARPLTVTQRDAAQWVKALPPGGDLHAFALELAACFADKGRSLEALYHRGSMAQNAIDLMPHGMPPFSHAPIDGEHPRKVIESLTLWLTRGFELWRDDEGMTFLDPSPLCYTLPRSRVIVLDATPNAPLLSWLAEALGMEYKQTKLPRPTQNIIQIPDLLWTGAQLDTRPEALALRDMAEKRKACILTKKARALEGDAYLGRDERGLNTFKDAPFTLIEGHHMMSDAQAKRCAFIAKALAAYLNTAAPLADAPVLDGKDTRTFGDPYRPWERTQHASDDPLAENIRRHHYSATILQGVARDRDPEKKKFVLAGSPIELDGKPYPVKLWTLKELRSFLESEGEEVEEAKRETPTHIQERNKAKKEEHKRRVQEEVLQFIGMERMPTITEIRRRLGGKARCGARLAKAVFDELLAQTQNEQKQGLVAKKKGVHTELLINLDASVCTPCVLENDLPICTGVTDNPPPLLPVEDAPLPCLQEAPSLPVEAPLSLFPSCILLGTPFCVEDAPFEPWDLEEGLEPDPVWYDHAAVMLWRYYWRQEVRAKEHGQERLRSLEEVKACVLSFFPIPYPWYRLEALLSLVGDTSLDEAFAAFFFGEAIVTEDAFPNVQAEVGDGFLDGWEQVGVGEYIDPYGEMWIDVSSWL